MWLQKWQELPVTDGWHLAVVVMVMLMVIMIFYVLECKLVM